MNNVLLTLADVEERFIRARLILMNYNVSEAAKTLGISRSTIYRKIKQYNIKIRGEK